MLKSRKKKITALCCALALVVTCAFPAFAKNHNFGFDFSLTQQENETPGYSKDDNDPDAYIKLTSGRNWGGEWVYFYVINESNQTVTDPDFYLTYADNQTHSMRYYSGENIAKKSYRLHGWQGAHDDRAFSVSGRFCP